VRGGAGPDDVRAQFVGAGFAGALFTSDSAR